ncbi:MAG: hypothetical protein ACE5FS_02415 [Paracoccaceae bacterium]
MTDTFKTQSQNLTAPPQNAVAITPNDAGSLSYVTRALFIGATGDVAVRLQGGQTVTFSNMQGGALYAMRVDQVLATGTTATGIVGLW